MIRKFLLFLSIFVILNGVVMANPTPINFVYIHGSDQGTVEEFEVWIKRMHPNMKKNLEANTTVQEHFLKNSLIKDEPDMLYWADKTVKDKTIVEMGLEISNKICSFFAQFARSTLAHLLHDAIWLQKHENMSPILNDLNKKVIANYNKGEKTVLIGYSAGTFITYQYLLNKTPFIKVLEFANLYKNELNLSDSDIDDIKTYAPQKTCIDAFVDSKVAIMTANGGLILNPNKEISRNNLKKLNEQTELSCSPKDAVSGVIDFGSPVVIFYSELSKEESQATYFTNMAFKEMVETGKFYLTVNYKKDPLGIPVDNITFADIKKYPGYEDTKNGGGFMYNTSINGGLNVIVAHLKYWDQTNRFTKAVAENFEKGYKYFYGINEAEQ